MKSKKYILILVVALAFPVLSRACDICACGVGSSYIGILPDFHKQILGLRYRYNSTWTHVGVGGSFTYLTTKEISNAVEVWGAWNLGEKFRIMVSLPYSFNERISQEVSNSKSGIGDMAVWGYYQLLNSRHTVLSNTLLAQSLWLGGGIKLATGAYNTLDKNTNNDNANGFQLGTGSYDFNIGAMYDLRWQEMGINLNAHYKVTNPNAYDYQYGNKLDLNTQVYYKFRIKNKLTLAPNAGVQYESAKNDLDRGFHVAASGGQVMLMTAGLEVAIGKVAIGANIQSPFSQDLGNGIVKANDRMMLHIALVL